ncbi:MAG: hypothetical protein LC737_10640, partial [Chloroflexi bacterium]|nr:hypothetical protein [Chloroflexota bacterium]
FARADRHAITHPLHVRFADSLELLGYDFEILPPRQVALPRATVRTYWRALRPLGENLRFAFRFYASEGYLGYVQSDSPTEFWYPTTKWRSDEVVVVEQRGVQAAYGAHIGVRVESGDLSTPTVLRLHTSEEMIEPNVAKLLEVGR